MAKRVTIDRAGRIVIPKSIRDRYGLHSGSDLEIAADGNRISLEPVTEEAVVSERGKMLIIASELAGEPGDVRSLREERLDRLSGDRK